MKKNSWIYLGALFVFSALGSFCRWLQNLNSFDAETGLYQGFDVISAILIVLCIGFAVFSCAFLSRLPGDRLGKTPHALFCNTAVPVIAVIFAAAILYLAGAVLLLFRASGTPFPLLTRILAALALLSALGIPVLLSESGKRSASALACVCIAASLVLFFFWLITEYKNQSSNPVVWSFAFEILAISTSLLAYYYVAGHYFDRPNPKRLLFFSGLACVFCFITLSDNLALGEKALFLGTSLFHGAVCWSLLHNASEKVS